MDDSKHLPPLTEDEITARVVRMLVKVFAYAFVVNVVVLVAVFGAPILVAAFIAAVGIVGLLALVSWGMDGAPPADRPKTYRLL